MKENKGGTIILLLILRARIENDTLFTDNYPLMEPVPIIPESPSWIILLLIIVATSGVIIVRNILSKKGLE